MFVILRDFGNFWLRFSAEGVEDSARVNGNLITTLIPRFNPGKRFKRVLKQVRFQKMRKQARK